MSIKSLLSILEKVGKKETYFPVFKDWIGEVLVPCYNKLMAGNEAAQKSPTSSATKDQGEVEDLIVNLLRKAAENPVEVIECVIISSAPAD